MRYGKNVDPLQNNKEIFGDSFIYRAFQTDQIGCGILTLEPGKTAGYDAGHKDADEVFYIVEGRAEIEYPDANQKVLVNKGECIMNYRNRPHVVHNPGNEKLVLLFACCTDR